MPLDQASDARFAEDIEMTVRLHPKGTVPRITTDLEARDKLKPGEQGLNIHGDRIFELLVHALYHHYQHEVEIDTTCCVKHYAEEIAELLERIDEGAEEEALLGRRMPH